MEQMALGKGQRAWAALPCGFIVLVLFFEGGTTKTRTRRMRSLLFDPPATSQTLSPVEWLPLLYCNPHGLFPGPALLAAWALDNIRHCPWAACRESDPAIHYLDSCLSFDSECCICLFLAALGFELRALYLLGRYSYHLNHSISPLAFL
jgi:hypothetical protein